MAHPKCRSGFVGLGLSLCFAASSLAGVLAVDDAGTARNGKVGHFSSLVASANETAIAYYCEQDPGGLFPASYSVRFAWKSGGCWQVANVGSLGSYNCMKRDASGLYHIVFSGWNGLEWAAGSGRSWTIAPDRVDSGVAPSEVSIALDANGYPHVAYHDSDSASGRPLKYTHWNGTQWMRGPSELIASNIWTPTILAGSTFLALDTGGVPHVAFAQPADAVNAVGPIKYATLQNGAWVIETLGITGENPSLAIGSDNIPRVAFQGGAGLTYAYKSGGAWTIESVPTSGFWPNTVTMALAPGNAPVIGFAMTANEDMYLATRSVAGSWNVAMVDGDGRSDGSLLLGRLCVGLGVDPAGAPHLSYSAITIYPIGGNVTDHYSNLRYYTSGDAGTICPIGPGACCDAATLACTILLPADCAGTFNGSGTCAPNPCDLAVACCDAASACTITPRSQCAGTFYASATCTPNPCIPIDPTGACCTSSTGACALTLASACTGTFNGAAGCSPNPCPQPATGACCSPAGVCSIATAAACAGTWNGATSCSPNPCPPPTGVGACCEGTTCSVMPAADCDHGVFQGNGVACGADNNPTVCCPANFNLADGVTVQDIFDYLTAWFAGTPNADFNHTGGLTVQDIFDFLSAWFNGCS